MVNSNTVDRWALVAGVILAVTEACASDLRSNRRESGAAADDGVEPAVTAQSGQAPTAPPAVAVVGTTRPSVEQTPSDVPRGVSNGSSSSGQGTDAVLTPRPVTGSSGSCLEAGSEDFAEAGPYEVASEVVDLGAGIASNQRTGEFTVFYPQPLEPDCLHPIVAWGNGTGVTGPAVYEFFNRNAASWGVVVIAAHDSNTGSGEYHRRGLDYLLAQNDDPSSRFFGKLSPRAGVSGHSQGGFGAASAASHPGVQALVVIGASRRPSESSAFLCLTGTLDIAPDACRTAVGSAPGPALAAIWQGGDHVVTETVAGFLGGDPGTIQMMRLYTAWFRCFLADDRAACDLFTGGESCTVCNEDGLAEVVTRDL